MVDTKHPPAKRRWKAVCRRRRGRPRASYQSLSQLTSLAAAAREQRQTRAAAVEDATLMSHDRETRLSNDLGGDDLSVISSSLQVGSISTPRSVSSVPLQKDVVNSNDPRKAENMKATNGSQLKMGSSSKDLVNQERSMVNRAPAGDEYFKQGLQFMVNGFYSLAKAAQAEQLPQLMVYGRIILRNFADLGIADSGFGAHLDSLQQQAADVASRQSMASSSKTSHASLVVLMCAADRETFEARQKKAAINEEVSDCTRQVERTEASLAEAKEKEEMARRARVQVEEELAREKVKLTMAEASSEKTTHDLEEKEEASAKAKEKANRAEEELQVHMEALKESKAKWETRCGQDPIFAGLGSVNGESLFEF